MNKICFTEEQLYVINLPDRGDFLIRGGAGTGKTLTAMERALKMKQEHLGARVGFFTFNTALCNDVKARFNEIAGCEHGIEVRTFANYVYHHWFWKRKIDEVYLEQIHRKVMFEVFPSLKEKSEEVQERYLDFFYEEFRWIKGRELKAFEEYSNISRRGRGGEHRFTHEQREKVWNALVRIDQIKFAQNPPVFDWIDRVLYVLRDGNKEFYAAYDHLIVDEAQDFTLADLLLIKRLVKPGGTLMLMADAAQKIYSSGATWKDAGIALQGRGHSFTSNDNFRNTHEVALLGEAFRAQIKDREDFTSVTLPIGHGPIPICYRGNTIDLEMKMLQMLEAFPNQERVVVATHTREDAEVLASKIHQYGFNVHNLMPRGRFLGYLQEKRTIEVSTLHSLKGLQFEHVLLWDISMKNFPITGDDAEDATMLKLLYMSVTRAQKTLTIFAGSSPSFFLTKIPASVLLHHVVETASTQEELDASLSCVTSKIIAA